jgi:hypothetical protein
MPYHSPHLSNPQSLRHTTAPRKELDGRSLALPQGHSAAQIEYVRGCSPLDLMTARKPNVVLEKAGLRRTRGGPDLWKHRLVVVKVLTRAI